MSWVSAPVVVLIGIILLLMVVSVVSMIRYPADETVKILSVFVGLFGAIIGAAGTFFFNKDQLAAAQRQVASYRADADRLTAQVASLQAAGTVDSDKIAAKVAAAVGNQGVELGRLHRDLESLRTSIASGDAETQSHLASLTTQIESGKADTQRKLTNLTTLTAVLKQKVETPMFLVVGNDGKARLVPTSLEANVSYSATNQEYQQAVDDLEKVLEAIKELKKDRNEKPLVHPANQP